MSHSLDPWGGLSQLMPEIPLETDLLCLQASKKGLNFLTLLVIELEQWVDPFWEVAWVGVMMKS